MRKGEGKRVVKGLQEIKGSVIKQTRCLIYNDSLNQDIFLTKNK